MLVIGYEEDVIAGYQVGVIVGLIGLIGHRGRSMGGVGLVCGLPEGVSFGLRVVAHKGAGARHRSVVVVAAVIVVVVAVAVVVVAQSIVL